MTIFVARRQHAEASICCCWPRRWLQDQSLYLPLQMPSIKYNESYPPNGMSLILCSVCAIFLEHPANNLALPLKRLFGGDYHNCKPATVDNDRAFTSGDFNVGSLLDFYQPSWGHQESFFPCGLLLREWHVSSGISAISN